MFEQIAKALQSAPIMQKVEHMSRQFDAILAAQQETNQRLERLEKWLIQSLSQTNRAA